MLDKKSQENYNKLDPFTKKVARACIASMMRRNFPWHIRIYRYWRSKSLMVIWRIRKFFKDCVK